MTEPKPIFHPKGYQDPLETWSAKFVRKFNENPLVPIGRTLVFQKPSTVNTSVGCLLTCGALIVSAHKLRQGRSKEMNTWLRARVVLQGVTIVALVAGSLQLKRARETQQALVEANAGEKQKQAFENRLKEAERATFEEAEMARALAEGESSDAEGAGRPRSSWWRWSRGSEK